MINWKKEAEDILRNLPARRISLEVLPEQISAVELQLTSTRGASTDSTPVQGGVSTTEDLWLTNIVRKDKLEGLLRVNTKLVEVAERCLGALSPDEQMILDMFYISRPKHYVAELCERLGVEEPTVYDRKTRALKRFTLLMYGLEYSQ